MAEETVRTEAQKQEAYIQELTERINGQLVEIAELHRKNTDIYKGSVLCSRNVRERNVSCNTGGIFNAQAV